MFNIYIYVSTVIFGLLSMIWSRKSWINLFLKIVFMTLFLVGSVVSLQLLGYVINS